MMKRKLLLSGFLSLALTGSIMAAALAETFERTLILGPGAGEFSVGDLGVGDTLVLTLVNPTNQPLTFETTENIGNEKSWTVPPGGRHVVTMDYTRPFDDDLEFVVRAPGGVQPIASGTLVRQGAGVTERPAGFMPTPTEEERERMESRPVMERPAAAPIRGFW